MVLIILWVIVGIIFGWAIGQLLAKALQKSDLTDHAVAMAIAFGIVGYTFGVWLTNSVPAFA